MISRSDRVFARVVSGSVYYVERNEAEIIIGSESGANRDRTAVLKPLDSHRRIAHRLQTTLQVNVFALANRLGIAQRLYEDRLRLGDLLDVIMRLDEFRFF